MNLQELCNLRHYILPKFIAEYVAAKDAEIAALREALESLPANKLLLLADWMDAEQASGRLYPWSLVWFDSREEIEYGRHKPDAAALSAEPGPIRGIARILTRRGVRWRFIQEAEMAELLRGEVVGKVERLPLQRAEMQRWATIRYRRVKYDEDQTVMEWEMGRTKT